MQVVISPSKTLDFDTQPNTATHTMPQFLDKSAELAAILKSYSANDLKNLMGISDKLADLNHDRFQNWQPNYGPDTAKQCIYAFKGDVYEGLDSESLNNTEIEQAQKTLRIISGLYGLLRPLDLILPYRLEMGTKLSNPAGKNLYEFWASNIADKIESDILINLASNEYFKAIGKHYNGHIIDIDFKENKNGQYKTIGIHAKKARGLMARWIILNKPETKDLTQFNIAGYEYNNELSDTDKIVFTR